MRTQVNMLAAFLMSGLLLAGSHITLAGPKGDTIVDVAMAVNSSEPFAGAFDTLIAAVRIPPEEEAEEDAASPTADGEITDGEATAAARPTSTVETGEADGDSDSPDSDSVEPPTADDGAEDAPE